MSKPNIRPEHVPVIEKAITNILAAPDKFDMTDWFYCQYDANDTPCGTVGCLAGHIALAAGLKPENDYFVGVGEVKEKLGLELNLKYYEDQEQVGVGRVAGMVLGGDGPIDEVFFENQWPEEFKEQYRAAGFAPTKERQKKQAEIAVARLRHYLVTGE